MDKAVSKETGEIILIFDIPPKKNGKKCNCICIECKRPLIARTLGTKRRKCFAHTKKDEKACRKIREEKQRTSTTEQHAQNSPETLPTCLKKKKNIITQEISTNNTTLQDIWNVTNGPFIAISNNGWYVSIETAPQNQYRENQGKCLGKITKDFENLFKNIEEKEIHGATFPIWTLIPNVVK